MEIIRSQIRHEAVFLLEVLVDHERYGIGVIAKYYLFAQPFIALVLYHERIGHNPAANELLLGLKRKFQEILADLIPLFLGRVTAGILHEKAVKN